MSAVVAGRRSQVEGQRSKVESGKAEAWAAKLLVMYTPEQVDQLLEVMQMTFDNAVIRQTEQTFTVLFNDKGHPRGFNGSNNVRPVKPVVYKPE